MEDILDMLYSYVLLVSVAVLRAMATAHKASLERRGRPGCMAVVHAMEDLHAALIAFAPSSAATL